jgi:hypothetical protein
MKHGSIPIAAEIRNALTSSVVWLAELDHRRPGRRVTESPADARSRGEIRRHEILHTSEVDLMLFTPASAALHSDAAYATV